MTHPKIFGKSARLVASGYAYCLVVFDDDTGLVFGFNDSCQCGYAKPKKIFDPLPLVIPSTSPISGLSAGQGVSLCMTKAKEIFITGSPGTGKSYKTWTRLDLTIFNLTFPVFDAYVIQNTVYILTLGK